MKGIIKQSNTPRIKNELEVSCGNCWGHQEYTDGYIKKSKDVNRNKLDNFISRFVNRYLRSSKR